MSRYCASREEKVAWLSQHPELWNEPKKDIVSAMKRAGLVSYMTRPVDVDVMAMLSEISGKPGTNLPAKERAVQWLSVPTACGRMDWAAMELFRQQSAEYNASRRPEPPVPYPVACSCSFRPYPHIIPPRDNFDRINEDYVRHKRGAAR